MEPMIFERDGVTAQALTPLLFTLTDAECAALPDEDTQMVTYRRVVDFDDGEYETETVTARVLRQSPDVIDTYADRLVKRDEGRNPYVVVTQLTAVKYPEGRQSSDSVAAALAEALGTPLDLTDLVPNRHTSAYVLGQQERDALARGLPLSRLVDVVRRSGAYLSRVRTLVPAAAMSPALAGEIARRIDAGDTEWAEARAAEFAQTHVNTVNGRVVERGGLPVYDSTHVRVLADERALDPEARPVLFLDRTADDHAALAPHHVDLAVSGDGVMSVAG